LEVQAGDDHKRPDGPENIRQEYRGTIIPCIRHRVRQNVADGIENKSANDIWSICTRVRLQSECVQTVTLAVCSAILPPGIPCYVSSVGRKAVRDSCSPVARNSKAHLVHST
jgi:hypothetical protein